MNDVRCQVLVVDDDPAIRAALGEILVEEGYIVVTTADGREAIALARTRRPQVILLDLMMPMMTGWELVEHLRRDPELRSIPVCILSAYADRAPAGVAAVLRKPLELEWLLQVIAGLCERTGGSTAEG